MIQSMYIRTDNKTASINDKSGKVVAYSKHTNKIAVRYERWTKDGRKYPARTVFYHIQDYDKHGLLWTLKLYEQLRIYHGKSDHIDSDKTVVF